MTVSDDDVDMWEQAWADRLLKGESVDGERGLSDLVSAVRATADTPAPAPNAALAALLREGLPTVDVPDQRRVPEQVRYWGSRTFRAGLAGVAASLAMGAGVATAAGGNGPLSYVPEPVKRGVDAAVTAVADVLRSGPETSDESTPEKAPERDDSAPRGDEPVTVKAPTPATNGPAAPTTNPAPPTEAPAKPVPTVAPAPSAADPSLPASVLPTPSSEPSPEPGPSKSPEDEGRKPLDSEKGGTSPSPSPSEEPSEEPSEAPAQEGEQAEDGPDEPSPGTPTSEARKEKPARAELTVERID